jgi:hypothetical protein
MNGVTRLLLGFLAGALSVLTFHQGMVAVLHLLPTSALHLELPPYRLTPVEPFGVPLLLDLCFWGALYGALFGLLHPNRRPAMWFNGFLLGLLAVAVDFFIVAPLKGHPFAANWVFAAWLRSVLINGSFGIGVGVLYPLISRRSV